MTGQSVNPEQPRGRGATRLELGRKSNEEPNLAPTYTEYRFLENVNRRGQKSGSPVPAAHFASAARFLLSGFDALPDGVRPMADIEPQSAEFLFDLQSIERASGCFLRNERLQVLA
jgi:hypothetical protein